MIITENNMPDTPHVSVEFTTRELQAIAICLEQTTRSPSFTSYPDATIATTFRAGDKIRTALATQPDNLEPHPNACTVLYEMHLDQNHISYRGRSLANLTYSFRNWEVTLSGSGESLGFYRTRDEAVARLASMILAGEIYL
jgi:hypothetical protein